MKIDIRNCRDNQKMLRELSDYNTVTKWIQFILSDDSSFHPQNICVRMPGNERIQIMHNGRLNSNFESYISKISTCGPSKNLGAFYEDVDEIFIDCKNGDVMVTL